MTYAFKGKADDFHRVFLDQVEEVDKVRSKTPLPLRLPTISSFSLAFSPITLPPSIRYYQKFGPEESTNPLTTAPYFFLEQQLGSIFANNKACNNPQSPAQLREFTKKVEAVKAEDIKLAQVFKDLIKENHLPREFGDNLEVTVSIHGADSDGEL